MTEIAKTMSQVVRTLSQAELQTLTDLELLQRFNQSDDAAFSALVRRHQAMVMGVCARTLGSASEAEDACQAVFLLLVQKVGTGRWQVSIANWLYTAARKIARNARVVAERRRRRENATQPAAQKDMLEQISARELLELLDRELDRLSPRYREPLVLCHLQGLTREEAARRLGVGAGTLKSQLERGRKQLANALRRHGCELGSVLILATTLSASQARQRLDHSLLEQVKHQSIPEEIQAMMKQYSSRSRITQTALSSIAFGTLAIALASIGLYTPMSAQPTSKTVSPPAIAKEDPKEVLATFSGQYVDSTGKGIANGKVYLFLRDRAEQKPVVRATTDTEGKFRFEIQEKDIPDTADVRPGNSFFGNQIAIKADGFAWTWTTLNRLPGDLKLQAHQEGELLKGRVIDLEGKPIAGVKVVPMGAIQAPQNDIKTLIDRMKKGESFWKSVSGSKLDYWHDPFIWRRPNPLLPTGMTDSQGRFEIRGYATGQIVEVRLEGATIEYKTAYFLMDHLERLIAVKQSNDEFDSEKIEMYGNGMDIVAAAGMTVEGTLRDAETDQPIPFAEVKSYMLGGTNLARNLVYSTQTDAAGRYRMSGLPRKKGNRLRFHGNSETAYIPKVIEVPMPKLLENAKLSVNLKRGVWVELQTKDTATGKPIPGAIGYFVLSPKRKEDRFAVVEEYSDAYDDFTSISNLGTYRFPAVPDQVACIGFQADRLQYGIADNATKYENFGGLSAVNFQQIIEICPRKEDAVYRVKIELNSGGSVSGTITDPAGKPIKGCLITGLNHDWYIDSESPSQSETIKVIGLKKDRPRLICVWNHELKLAGHLVVKEGNPPFTIKLQPAGRIEGRLLDDKGKPKAKAYLFCSDMPPQLKGETRNIDTGYIPIYRTPRTVDPQTDEDGRFVMEGFSPGLRYHLVQFDPTAIGVNESPFVGLIVRDLIMKPGEKRNLGDIRLQPIR